LGRYISEGAAGLAERSHAPLQHGQAHEVAVVQAVLGLRQRWPHWGPKKLRVKLVEHHPELPVPAASTIGEWLRRGGVAGRSRRRRAYTQPFAAVTAANDVWCTDFKGWFRTGDGRRCDPFTLTDAHSRYLLRCQAVLRCECAADLRGGVPGAWLAAGDPFGQRPAFCLAGCRRAVTAGGVVGQAGHPARAGRGGGSRAGRGGTGGGTRRPPKSRGPPPRPVV